MYPSEANASAPRLNRDVATASVGPARMFSSLAGIRAGERAKLAASINADPKFKKYTTQVERCLQTFDNVHEWADFIAFLTKLLKTFQSHMQFKEIPRKLTVAKRLSQCLNPALPTGVHQRALDVYTHILAVIGSEGLKRDLQLWSAGLFPFFEYAATSVKPTILNLYDIHYLPLQEALRPVMKAFILALLPGLEEETEEFFEKVLAILDRLSGTVSPAFFLQNVWLVMLTTPASRGTALNFLSRRLPKLSGDEDITPIVGRDMGLMIRAFSAALEDDNLLVRRGALDLLVQTLPVDSGALKRAQETDRRILMKAAVNVVLRRDLSLNRRLYAWLLGPGSDESQSSPAKVAFFREHALELLCATFREDMVSPRTESRPFKVFISLLDRWELGGPLVDVLLYDAIKAVKWGAVQQGDMAGDLLMTANTLYDAVEPLAVWKQLFMAVHSELSGSASSDPPLRFEAMSLVKFILTRLRIQDDEVRDLHLPLFFAGTLELVKMLVTADMCNVPSDSLHEALQLLMETARHISITTLTKSAHESGKATDVLATAGPYSRACKFYGIQPVEQNIGQPLRSGVPFVTAFEDLIALSIAYAQGVASENPPVRRILESFDVTLALLEFLVARRDDTPDGMSLDWSPASWLVKMLATLEQSSSFVVTDKVISTVIAISGSQSLHPPLVIDERATMLKAVNALFHFLRTDYAPYHVRAVHLIWMLENATTHHHVESIVAQSLTSPESRNVHEAYEAFGVLWRLTDDSLLPGFRFKIPMLIVLDTLKNHDPNLRRIGETWMRCSLKSYNRVLEPLLHDLLDPSILRTPSEASYNGQEVTGYTYQQRFDQRRMDHVLETLLSLVKFGGQGFSRVARSTKYKNSNHAEFIVRVESAEIVPPDATYMDVLLEILLRFLQSEPRSDLVPFMEHANAQIQANAIDLIQTIVARGELDAPGLAIVEDTVVGKLFLSVHLDRVDLQNKLLHVLHSIISATSAVADSHLSAAGSSSRNVDSDGHTEELPHLENAGRSSSFVYINPLLARTLIDGITTAAGRPTLQHWLDFVLMTVPQYSRALGYMVSPLSDCVCRQLRHALVDIKRVLDHDSTKSESVVSGTTDAEFIMLLNALERLVLLSLSKSHDPPASEDESISEKTVPDPSGSGILGIVSNVFSSDGHGNSTEEYLSARSPGYQALNDAVRALHSLWVLTGNASNIPTVPQAETLSLIFTRARTRGRKVLERLFRSRATEVMESIVECWWKGTLEHGDRHIAFEIVDVLTSSSQTVVHMLCESILYRVTTSEKIKKPAVNPNLSDIVIFSFLEEYISRLEGPLVIQIWGRCMTLAKEILSNVHGYKLQLFPTLRCITVLADKITQTTAIDDRKTRKELQDTFVKLVDNSILIAGRSFDQSTWIRRSTRGDLNVNGGASLLPRTTSDGTLDEKTVPSSVEGSIISVDPADQINGFMASRVLPNLRRILFDNDKVAGVCTNVVYYIITPAMKMKTSRTFDVDESILDILRELSKLPPSAKAWRNPVSEVFNDNRFFNSALDTSQKWRPIIRALVDTDRQVLPELLGKITSTGSANIFANREYETLVRSLNLRRLSYVVLAGEKNHFLTQLPPIQEKLVDILRNPNSPMMQSEVYLCLRVLLCRLSPHNLSSFWPVILTELLRIFDQVVSEPPSDGSEDLQVILSASKFLDLVITLQTEEFQIHQWMFVTDTVDAVYRPDSWFPEALLDQLAEIISDLPAPNPRETKPPEFDSTPLVQYGRLDSAISYSEPPTVAMRRPLLSSVRHIDSIRDLVPFFSHVSISSYEGVYHCAGNIDWDAIEKNLLEEMFDGRS